jgi:uncharacterized membrane protein (DUF106 family)
MSVLEEKIKELQKENKTLKNTIKAAKKELDKLQIYKLKNMHNIEIVDKVYEILDGVDKE